MDLAEYPTAQSDIDNLLQGPNVEERDNRVGLHSILPVSLQCFTLSSYTIESFDSLY